jgi:TRAP transporter TAXI family solute receptor
MRKDYKFHDQKEEKMRKVIVLSVIGALILCFGTGVASAEWKPEKKLLKMVSGPEGGSWYPLGSGIMRLVEANIKGVSTSNAQGGGVGNCKAIQRGDADLGWSFAHTVYDAYNGRPPFTKKLSKIRYLASLYPGVWQVVVPRKSNIYSYADLADKRIVPGKVGFSGEVLAKSILGVYGITYESIKKKGGVVNFVGSYADSKALMQDGHLDAFLALTSCPQATLIELNFRPGIRLLPVDKEHMKKFLKKYPGYMETVIPKGAYKGVTKDIPTIGTVSSLVVSADLSDEMVYRITKGIFENLPELAKIKKKAIAEVSLENGLRGAMIPIHPGAKRYYDEKGVKVK